jgi:hypothetical protein
LFDFQPGFIGTLDAQLAAWIEEATGHRISPFGADDERADPIARVQFSAKNWMKFVDGFIEALQTALANVVQDLKQQKRNELISYKVGIVLCVACGDWADEAVFGLGLRRVVSC